MTRTERLLKTINARTGLVCEITVRGDREFTISCEGNGASALESFAKELNVKYTVEYTEDIDFTCLFLSV